MICLCLLVITLSDLCWSAYSVVVADLPAPQTVPHSKFVFNCSNGIGLQSTDSAASSLSLAKYHNCTDVEVSVQKIPTVELHWKNQVIIACTITVAIEVLIVALMVMCWRQIRWTLLKLNSCLERRQRHTAMQRRGSSTGSTGDTADNAAGSLNADVGTSVSVYVPVDNLTGAGGQQLIMADDMGVPSTSRGLEATSYTPLSQNERDCRWRVFADSSSDDTDADNDPTYRHAANFMPRPTTPIAAASSDIELVHCFTPASHDGNLLTFGNVTSSCVVQLSS